MLFESSDRHMIVTFEKNDDEETRKKTLLALGIMCAKDSDVILKNKGDVVDARLASDVQPADPIRLIEAVLFPVNTSDDDEKSKI